MMSDGGVWLGLLGLAVVLAIVWRRAIAPRGNEPQGGFSRMLDFLGATIFTLFLVSCSGLLLGFWGGR